MWGQGLTPLALQAVAARAWPLHAQAHTQRFTLGGPQRPARCAHTMIRLDLRIELNYDIDAFGADFILNIHPALTSQQRVVNENLWLSQPLAPLLPRPCACPIC